MERMMNRHERRKAKRTQIDPNTIDETCDIQVDGKVGQIVMVFANAKGRKIVEDLWPDVQWTTDVIFAEAHSTDWLFTHIRVTRLPPFLDSKVPLAFASPDALGYAVAMAIQRRAEPLRVVHYTGSGTEVILNRQAGVPDAQGLDVALFAEYVPAGTLVGEPQSVN